MVFNVDDYGFSVVRVIVIGLGYVICGIFWVWDFIVV